MTRKELIAFANEEWFCIIGQGNWPKRINKCSAWYVENENYAILRSYTTIVAIQNKRTGTCFVFDYYSHTTSCHVIKFNDIVDSMRVTYLYHRSDRKIEVDLYGQTAKSWKLNAKQFRRVADTDFSIVIGNAWKRSI